MKRKEKIETCDSCRIDINNDMIADPEAVCEPPPKKSKKQKKKLSTGEKIYIFLDNAEKIATILADREKKKKKKAKKQVKKDKKIGKIDKKTGAVVLKKVKKDKIQKPMKRYKPPKK